jgi:glycosyltransferase involved in cell wall biosynthesis
MHVLSCQPSYKAGTKLGRQAEDEALDGFRIHRLDLPAEHGRPAARLVNMVRFAAAILRHVRERRPYDVIMASTAPPVVVGAAASLAARRSGARFFYHCMDIHPEIGRISGEFRNPAVFSLLRRVDALSCRTADPMIVLSDDMAAAVSERPDSSPRSTRVINNFALPNYNRRESGGLPEGVKPISDRFRIVFAGNLGRFQGLEAVVDAMHELRGRGDVELILLGEGTAAADLRHRAGPLAGDTVRFVPHQPVGVARRVMQACDAGLVTLTPGIYRYAYPSKTMTYLREGLPLVVAVEPGSSLASFIQERGVGVTVSPRDVSALAAVFSEWARNPGAVRHMSSRAGRVAAQVFAEDVVLDHWSGLLSEVAESS